MPTIPNRSVVIIAALLTLLVLSGATMAVALRNGWVHVASAAPHPDAVTALAQPADTDRSRTITPSPEAGALAAPGANVDPTEIALYRGKLEDAYRALDDAYAQVRSLQAAQSQLPSRGDKNRASAEHDDDRHERSSGHRESDEN